VQISTAAQLGEIRNHLDRHYILASDIDLASYTNWEPIGVFEPVSDAPEDAETANVTKAFSGSFDGNGHKISNIVISAPEQTGVGLFGCVAGDGVVKNLVVENVAVTGMMLVGGVIGYSAENPIEHITLQGTNTITGGAMVGGITGGGFTDIKNCTATASVVMTGIPSMGGGQGIGILAGGMESCSIISCIATGTVTVTGADGSGIGGLVGCGQESPEITNCMVDATINVTGADCIMIGGLVGFAGVHDGSGSTVISGCTVNAAIAVPASAGRIGGIVGSGFYMSAYAAYIPTPGAFVVKNSSSSGTTTAAAAGASNVGTIAGYIYDNSTLEGSCSSTMTINGGSAGTPLVGGNKSSVDLPGLI
jgi:hypothetical protein